MTLDEAMTGRWVQVAAALLLAVGGGAFGFAWLTRSPTPTPIASPPQMAEVPAAVFDPAFRRCAHCHDIGKGARHKLGPQLNDVLGRPAGRLAGYPFSKSMRESGIVWDAVALASFLRNPSTAVPGTRMMFEGIPDEAEVARVIEFLVRRGNEGRPPRRVGRAPG